MQSVKAVHDLVEMILSRLGGYGVLELWKEGKHYLVAGGWDDFDAEIQHEHNESYDITILPCARAMDLGMKNI